MKQRERKSVKQKRTSRGPSTATDRQKLAKVRAKLWTESHCKAFTVWGIAATLHQTGGKENV